MNHPAVPAPRYFPDPRTGEAIDLTNPATVAETLHALRDFQATELRATIAVLEDTLAEESERQGTKTLRFGAREAVISQDVETVYDIERLRRSLRNAGCPEERIDELITETVTYKVNGTVARQLAASNPKYRRALERNRTRTPGRVRVTVR